MSKNIRGITVEIGGDTTKLGKALEDVDKQGRNLSSELGQINKLLKLDPGNTELLAQKQKVLAEATENTKEKLDTLKKAEEQVQKQFERGEVSEEQVRALQREIIATTTKLQSYEKASKETADKIEALGKNSNQAEDKVEDLGEEAKKSGKELDTAGDKGTAFGEKVKKAGSVALAGLKTVTAGATAMAGALAGASVSGAEYADNILTMSTVTGVSTEKLQEFNYMSELVDVSVETLTKSMAKNVKSMKGAQDGSKAYVETYQKLGVSVTDANGNLRDSETVYWECIDALGKMENETERDALAMQIFGKSAQELNPLIEAGSKTMKNLADEAHNVGAVLSEDALASLGSFDDSIQRLKGSAGSAKNSLGSVLLPELQMLTDNGTDLLNEFVTELNNSGGGLDGFIQTIDNMSENIAEVVSSVLSELIGVISTIAPSFVQVAMDLITTLVTTLVGKLPELLNVGIEIILALINGLTTAIPNIVTAVVGIIPELVNALVTGIPLLIQGAVQLLLAIVDAIPQIIPPLVTALPTVILAIIDGLMIAIPQLLQGAIQFLMAIIQAIPVIVDALLGALPTIINTIIDGLIIAIPQLIQGAIQLLMAIVEAIPVIIDALIEALPTIINTIIDGLLNSLPLLLQGAIQLLMAIIQAIPTIISLLVKDIPNIVTTIISTLVSRTPDLIKGTVQLLMGIVKAIPQIIKELVKQIPTIITTIVKSLSNGLSQIKDVGKNLIRGLWEGISDMVGWIGDKIKGFGESVLGGLKSFFGIHSPSAIMRDEVGKFISEGIAVGITENGDSPIDAIDQVGNDMLNEAKTLNGATIRRQIETTFNGSVSTDTSILERLDSILTKLENKTQIILDSGVLVGETIGQIDAGLASLQLLKRRGV